MRSMLLHSDGVVTYSKWNEASILKMNDAGACGNTMDIMIQRVKNNELVKDIQKCMLQCIVSGESCVVDCVSKNVGLSRPCSACWGEEGQFWAARNGHVAGALPLVADLTAPLHNLT